MISSNKVFKQITELISVNYVANSYDHDTDEYMPSDDQLMVQFNNSDVNSFLSITKGDDSYYEPSYPEELIEVRRDYGDSYISVAYSQGTRDGEDNFTPDPESVSYHIRELPDWYYVTFSYSFIGKTKKFKEVEDAIQYALTSLRSYFQCQNTDLGYLIFDLNFNKK